jgi:hypothetical protein
MSRELLAGGPSCILGVLEYGVLRSLRSTPEYSVVLPVDPMIAVR